MSTNTNRQARQTRYKSSQRSYLTYNDFHTTIFDEITKLNSAKKPKKQEEKKAKEEAQ